MLALSDLLKFDKVFVNASGQFRGKDMGSNLALGEINDLSRQRKLLR